MGLFHDGLNYDGFIAKNLQIKSVIKLGAKVH